MSKAITVSKEEYDSMKETLEVLSDTDLLRDIQEGIMDIRQGRTLSLKKYLSRLKQ